MKAPGKHVYTTEGPTREVQWQRAQRHIDDPEPAIGATRSVTWKTPALAAHKQRITPPKEPRTTHF